MANPLGLHVGMGRARVRSLFAGGACHTPQNHKVVAHHWHAAMLGSGGVSWYSSSLRSGVRDDAHSDSIFTNKRSVGGEGWWVV